MTDWNHVGLRYAQARQWHARKRTAERAKFVHHSKKALGSPDAAMRTFLSPSGRTWTVRLFYFPSPPTAALKGTDGPVSLSVLRFESDGLTLDLSEWPPDWLTRSDEELVALVRLARTPA